MKNGKIYHHQRVYNKYSYESIGTELKNPKSQISIDFYTKFAYFAFFFATTILILTKVL